jgi:hypothetical protein
VSEFGFGKTRNRMINGTPTFYWVGETCIVDRSDIGFREGEWPVQIEFRIPETGEIKIARKGKQHVLGWEYVFEGGKYIIMADK